MKKETLKEMVVRIITEETGKVTAKPRVKKGDVVKVLDHFSGKWEEVTAAEDAKLKQGTWIFDGDGGEIVYFNDAKNQWESEAFN